MTGSATGQRTDESARRGADAPAWSWQPRWVLGRPPRRPRPTTPRAGPFQPVPAWATQLVGFTDERTGRPHALVTGYAGGRALLDLVDGGVLAVPDERASPGVCAIARVAGETLLVSAAGAGHLQLTDLATGRPRWRRWCGEIRSLVTVNLAGRTLAVLAGGSPHPQVWSLALDRGERLTTLRGGGDRVAVLAATTINQDAVVAAGTVHGRVRLWRIGAAREGTAALRVAALPGLAVDPPGLVGALDFAEWSGRPVLLGAAGRLVRAWDVASGAPLGPVFAEHTGPVTGVVAGRLGTRPALISSDDSTVRAWAPESGTELATFHYPYEAALTRMTTAVVAGRPVLVTGDGAGLVWRWDPEQPYPFRRGPTPGGGPGPAAHDPDPVDSDPAPVGPELADPSPAPTGAPVTRLAVLEAAGQAMVLTGQPDGTVQGFDLLDGTGREIRFANPPGPVSLAPGDRPVLVRSGPAGIDVWDPATGDRLGPTVAYPGAADGRWPDGPVAAGRVDGRRTLVLAVGAELYRVDVRTGHLLGPLVGHTAPIHAVTVTGMLGVPVALTAAADDTVRLWELRSGRSLRTVLDGHGGGAYAVTVGTVRGRELVFSAGRNGQVRVGDLTDLVSELTPCTRDAAGEVAVEPMVPLTATGPVRALAVAPSHRPDWLVVADGATLWWHPLVDGVGPSQTADLRAPVTALAASADGVLVATGDGLLAYRPPGTG